jgi:hypothetical protein
MVVDIAVYLQIIRLIQNSPKDTQVCSYLLYKSGEHDAGADRGLGIKSSFCTDFALSLGNNKRC